MNVSRFEIRREYQALQEALTEKFLKASDPSISVLNFIESISNCMGAIKRAYAEDASNRNAIIPVVLKELNEMDKFISLLRDEMNAVKSDPEDTNRKLPDAADESVEEDIWGV